MSSAARRLKANRKIENQQCTWCGAGLQLGASQTEMLFIFKTPAALKKFVDSGWEVTNTATASAGASGATVGRGRGETAPQDAETYTLTKNGIEAGVAVGGSKFWKDKDLN